MFFFYHTSLFLAKELYNGNQTINDEIVNISMMHWLNQKRYKLKKFLKMKILKILNINNH